MYRRQRTLYDGTKPPEEETRLNKKMFMLADNKHKPVYHKDGHLLIFARKKDAEKWLEKARMDKNKSKFKSILDWRVVSITIMVVE